MDRQAVFNAVSGERDYQLRIWGTRKIDGTSGKEIMTETPHSPAEFLVYMQHHLSKAISLAATKPCDHLCLDAMREVVALGVSCFEQHGVPVRHIPNVGVINRRDGKSA